MMPRIKIDKHRFNATKAFLTKHPDIVKVVEVTDCLDLESYPHIVMEGQEMTLQDIQQGVVSLAEGDFIAVTHSGTCHKLEVIYNADKNIQEFRL